MDDLPQPPSPQIVMDILCASSMVSVVSNGMRYAWIGPPVVLLMLLVYTTRRYGMECRTGSVPGERRSQLRSKRPKTK